MMGETLLEQQRSPPRGCIEVTMCHVCIHVDDDAVPSIFQEENVNCMNGWKLLAHVFVVMEEDVRMKLNDRELIKLLNASSFRQA